MTRLNYRLSQSDSELNAARAVWNNVFVNELGEASPENPWGSELGTQVFLVYEAKTAVAAAQLTPAQADAMLIEHVAVLRPHRGSGIGLGLIQAMIEAARSQHIKQVRLSARTDAQPFYQKLGFKAVSEEFEAFGSPHILMEKDLISTH